MQHVASLVGNNSKLSSQLPLRDLRHDAGSSLAPSTSTLRRTSAGALTGLPLATMPGW